MRIALINTFMPFIYGGAEIVVDDLMEQLREIGHEVVLLRIPFPKSYEADLIATIEATRMLCLGEFDRVIAFKFPAYCIRHHAKVIWMFHQFRQVYELWGGEYGLQPEPKSESIRKMVKAADDKDITHSRHVFTIAKEVSNRLKQYNNLDSIVLPPPLKNQELYYFDKNGDYFFFPSRITQLKRQLLAIEAMCYVKSGVRLIIAGVCERQYFEQLKKLICDNNLEKRVELRNGWLNDDEKRLLMSNALGVLYIPYKEDYGLVSLEAFYSAKPVITCIDSGGTTEFIENDKNGFVVQPDPKAIAKAMDILFYDKLNAERMGKAGFDEILRRDITWPSTIRKLLS